MVLGWDVLVVVEGRARDVSGGGLAAYRLRCPRRPSSPHDANTRRWSVACAPFPIPRPALCLLQCLPLRRAAGVAPVPPPCCKTRIARRCLLPAMCVWLNTPHLGLPGITPGAPPPPRPARRPCSPLPGATTPWRLSPSSRRTPRQRGRTRPCRRRWLRPRGATGTRPWWRRTRGTGAAPWTTSSSSS